MNIGSRLKSTTPPMPASKNAEPTKSPVQSMAPSRRANALSAYIFKPRTRNPYRTPQNPAAKNPAWNMASAIGGIDKSYGGNPPVLSSCVLKSNVAAMAFFAGHTALGTLLTTLASGDGDKFGP